MTTVEKLVVQIFDRKNWIIEQAKHQAELYNHHLASKLLIDGIAPPSWLWSTPNNHSPKEINKDELISKLLNPHPQYPACCSRPHYPLYSYQLGFGDNVELSDGVFIETLTSNKGLDRQDRPTVSAISGEGEAGCTSKNVSELHFSSTLPVDQTDERILNIHNPPDQSLAKIQRSKSRQKALELRSGSKSLTKIGLSHGNLNENFRLSILSTEQEGRSDELPKSTGRRGISEGGKKRDFGESACQSKENDMDISTGRVTRSRSCAKAPDFVGRSEGLGCEPGNCRKDVTSCGAKVGTRRSVSGYNSNQADYVNNLQQSAASFQTCVLGSLGGADRQGRDVENNVCTGNITGSGFSCREAGHYSNSNCSSDNVQINHDAIKEFKDHLPANRAHGSLVTVSGATVLDERGDACQSIAEDCKNEKEMTAVPWSSQHTAGVDEDPHQDTPSHFEGADRCPLPSTSGRLALVPNTLHKEPGLAESSFGVVHRVTRSKICAKQEISNFDCPITRLLCSISKSDLEKKSAASVDLLIAPCGQIIPPFHETHDIINEQQGSDNAVDSELVLCNLVDQSVSSSPIDTKQRGELGGSLVAGSSPNFSLFVEPKVLDVNDFNLKSSTSSSEMKRLNNMSEKMDCSFLDPATSIDKRTSGNMNQVTIDEESTERLGVCSKEGEAWGDSFHSNVGEHKMSKISQDNTMADLNCEISEGQDEINITESEVNDAPHIHSHPVKLRLDHCHDSLPVQHIEEGNWRAKSKDKVSLVSNASVSNACRQSNSLDLTNAESHDGLAEEGEMENSAKIKPIHAKDYQNLPCLEVEVSGQHAHLRLGESGLMIPNSDGSPVFDSWPQLKRRKIKHHESNRHTSSPCVRMKKLDSIQIGSSSTYMTNTEKDVKSTDMGTKELIDFDFTELEYTFESQKGEDRFCSKEPNKPKSSSTTSELSETTLLAGLAKKKAGNSGGLYVEGMATQSCILDDKQCSQHSSFLNENIADNTYDENLTLSRMNQSTISSECKEGLQSQRSVLSPRNNLECNVVDQSLPVFEEFMVDAQSYSGELDFPADEIDFEKLKSPRNMIERASILAKICKSASTDTPLSDFSSALERASLLESLDMNTLPLNGDDVDKQLGFGNSHVNNVKDSFERMPHSDSLPHYGARYGWNSRNLSASPVEKFWERLSLQSGSSSEKCMSTNPDLTCFRIEEDPCVSEENETMDDIADNVLDDNDSLPANPCDRRQPLKEITNLVVPPVSTEPISVSLTTKPIVGATQYKVERILRKQTPSVGNTEIREKQTFSVGANGIKKARESINRSVNRPVLRSKSSLKREEQKLSLKESRKNNIVSNVNSFLPLVQQKQASPICAGKREVKVKALEAAEAAKRLDERRQNERRIKKEALKSERAKLEKKNMREMESKKKKEAEHKKKEDDVITKKRLREEEERKEEKKKMRFEARQREQEEKLRMRAKKAEKQKGHSKGGRMNSKTQLTESENPHTNGIMRGDDSVLKDTETRRASTELAMHTVDKSPTSGILMAQIIQGKSYEISPYQCSDDEEEEEEEEEDELPIKKNIPSWASKSSVALLLPLQQEMEPDAIFPPDSFCSMDEVLLHRKVK